LLLDQGKSADAIALLEGMTSKSSSPTLLIFLGDAYTPNQGPAESGSCNIAKAAELDRE